MGHQKDWSKSSLGDRVTFLREHFGVTQNEFARRAGIPSGPMSRVARTKAREGRSPKTLRKIAEAWTVNLPWLSSGRGQPFEANGTHAAAGLPPEVIAGVHWAEAAQHPPPIVERLISTYRRGPKLTFETVIDRLKVWKSEYDAGLWHEEPEPPPAGGLAEPRRKSAPRRRPRQ